MEGERGGVFIDVASGRCDCGDCDGTGRQQGGMGALFPWWPIKVYRPCPAWTAAGGTYQRKGQITDEMLFGERKGK